MISEILVVGGSAVLVGSAIGYFLSKSKFFMRLINKEENYKHSIISDPEKLLEKIRSNGEIVSDGHRILPEYDFDDSGQIIGFKTEKVPESIVVEKRQQKPLPQREIPKKLKKAVKKSKKKKK